MNEDELKLELWREIMRTKPDYHYGGGMSMSTQITPANDPVVSARKAIETFVALYRTTTLVPTKKRGRRS